MGLLKTPEREENPLSPSTNEALKDPSPFKVKILDRKVNCNNTSLINAYPRKSATIFTSFEY